MSERSVPEASTHRPDGDRWLLGGNLLTLAMALWQGWSLLELLLPFWLQSVTIGVLQARRMWRLQSFSTKGFSRNGEPVAETRDEARRTVRTFALHYGGFHLFYLMVLMTFVSGQGADEVGRSILWFLPCVAGLLIAELFAHRGDLRRDAETCPRLGILMILPYVRIIPMHMMMFIGSVAGSSAISVVAFLLLKTASDWVMQWGKRKYEVGGTSEQSTGRRGRR